MHDGCWPPVTADHAYGRLWSAGHLPRHEPTAYTGTVLVIHLRAATGSAPPGTAARHEAHDVALWLDATSSVDCDASWSILQQGSDIAGLGAHNCTRLRFDRRTRIPLQAARQCPVEVRAVVLSWKTGPVNWPTAYTSPNWSRRSIFPYSTAVVCAYEDVMDGDGK
jgi:hypothetical protein